MNISWILKPKEALLSKQNRKILHPKKDSKVIVGGVEVTEF